MAFFGSTFDILKRHWRRSGWRSHPPRLPVRPRRLLRDMGAARLIASFAVFEIGVVWTYLTGVASVRYLRAVIVWHQWWLISFVGLNALAFPVASTRFPFHADVK